MKKELELLENKELRVQMLDNVGVLDKVKELLLLPNTDIATTKQVAEYFNVTQDVIRDNVRRHKEELTESGLKLMKYLEIKELLNSEMFSQLKISRHGANVFSKRAILNLAMLLRDSKVAKEVRQALLDQQEVITEEQKVSSLEYKQRLQLAIVNAKDEMELLLAVRELEQYNNRHIEELNANIQRMQPKADSFDKFISAEGYKNIEQVGKLLGKGRNKMFQYLREIKLLKSDNLPYQQYIDAGYFVVKENVIDKGYFTKLHSQTFVTPKGITYIEKKMKQIN